MPRLTDIINKANLPSKRSEAIALGVTHYFTGKACRRGHEDVRRVVGSFCMTCSRENAALARERIKSEPERLAERRAKQLVYALEVLKDPERKAQIRAREREVYDLKPERKARKKAVDAARNQREIVKFARRVRQKTRYHSVKDDPKFREAARADSRMNYLKNPDRYSIACSNRRAKKANATPKWVEDRFKEEIQAIYKTARSIQRASGVRMAVDHIVPIQHEAVCGLHVPWNLQVVTAKENASKSNVFDPSLGVAP